jgi:protein-disulfide isomerase
MRLAFLFLALPLALAACNKEAGSNVTGSEGSGPVKAVAPPAGKQWTDVVEMTSEGGYRMGNPAAPIKLVEFASLTCPHCAEFAEKGFAPLRDKYVSSGRLSFELRNFVRDPIDLTAAMLTRCGAPESYFALTEQVFANQPAIFERAQAGIKQAQAAQNLPDDRKFAAAADALGLTDFFAARGIARDQAGTCLARSGMASQLAQATQRDSEAYDIQGTPTFLINGRNVQVSTWEELEPLLQGAGAR